MSNSIELKSDTGMFSHPGDIGQHSESLDIRMGGRNQSERNILKERSGLGCTRGKTLAGERPEGCQSVTKVQSVVLGNACVVCTEKKNSNTECILARELHGS